MFSLRSLIGFGIFLLSVGNAYAYDRLSGCWSNVTNVDVDPKFSPLHEKTTSAGAMVCFEKHGVITTTSIGGFEALGSGGRFAYKSGHLTVLENEIADGWIFSHRKDRCAASVSTEQLKISGCKEWSKSKVLILHKQTTPPKLTGVAAGVFR